MTTELAQASDAPVPVNLSRPGLDASTPTFSVLQDVPASWTIEQIAAEPAGRFNVFDSNKTYRLNEKNALWLHFQVVGGSTVTQTGWTFELLKPFVDRVEFYSSNATGGWQMQQAGDHIPQSQWAVRGLHPQFPLPILKPGTNDFYVKVQQYFPLRFSANLKTTEEVIFQNQNTLFKNGLLIGLMLAMGLFALAIGVIYKNTVYPWYAIYIFFAILSNASYIGLGFYAFWPSSPKWAEWSQCVLLVAALAAQLQFCHALFVDGTTPKWLSRLVTIGVIFLFGTALVTAWIPAEKISWRIGVTVIAGLAALTLILLIVVREAYKRSLTAWICIVAYLPAVIFLVLSFVEQFAFAPLAWLPYNAIGFAVGFEVLILLVALHLHARSGHTMQVRQIAKDELDPLTGFFSPQQFEVRFKALWQQAEQIQADVAVVYVQVSLSPRHGATGGTFNHPQSIKRVAKILHTASREADTIALVAGNVFAILMPGISPSENLSAKLSRLVALGLMPDKDDPIAAPVYLRVVASSMCSFFGTPNELDALLFKTLRDTSLWQDRSIRMVRD